MSTEQPEAEGRRSVDVRFVPANVWRAGLALLAVAAVGAFLRFVIDDGGSVFFTILISWFAALAMAPAVDGLARRMKRGTATLLVMVAFIICAALFVVAFGRIFVDQIVELIRQLPGIVGSAVTWVNERFGTDITRDDVLDALNLSPSQASDLATKLAANVLSILGTVASTVFGLFTFFLFTFYLSADGPRLRRWTASLFPERAQSVVANVWDLTAQKTGGYVSARVVLAAINSATTAIVFLIIGMPYWLALAVWTGVVAQFVPTIGTYISIALPVLVGLTSDKPIVGVLALVWALIYQQVENLTLEPKISAKAVNVHPAVAFGSVMLGAALFGVAGAFLAIPVCAMLLALVDVYAKRYELLPELSAGTTRPRKGTKPLPVPPVGSDAVTEDEPVAADGEVSTHASQ
jgi:predicted PurR-regulated permease PerM